MVNKANAEIRAAVSLIISEDISALKKIVKKMANTPSKNGLNIRKRERGKK
jgi:hypothetical protein